jgi:hypothetical protein
MAVQVKAKFKLTGWNANQLKDRNRQILGKYQTVLDQQLKTEIQTQQFKWPRETRRRNGTRAGTTRDIVDLGNFLRSQRRSFDGRTTITFTWDVPYASLILKGYVTQQRSGGGRSGTLVEGRNWIKPALENAPLEQFFAQQWQQLAKQGL